MMDRDAIDRIVEVIEQRQPVITAFDYEHTGRVFVRDELGGYRERLLFEEPVERTFYETESLARFTSAIIAKERTAYYSDDEIITTSYDGDFERTVTHRLRLPQHPVFTRVATLGDRSRSQADLVRLLRADLDGNVDENVIQHFRRLRLNLSSETDTVIDKGRASVDRAIRQEIAQQSGVDVPDSLTLSVPVHDLVETLDDRYDVRVLVDTVLEAGKIVFLLTPVQSSLALARANALASIVKRFRSHLDESIPVYHGR